MRDDMIWDESVRMVDIDRIGEYGSPWGNSFCYITEQQLEELKNGKVIYFHDGEYGNFIKLKKEAHNG